MAWNQCPRYSSSTYRPNLHDYYDRIGYTGDKEPTLENLRQIHRLHGQIIPFENGDMHCGGTMKKRAIVIDPVVIEQKLVYEKRGGYCFEQNTLLFYVLHAMGYAVRPIISRGRWLIAEGVPTTPTHLIVRVEIDGKFYICDVGFCNCTPTEPIEMSPNEQVTSHDTRRIITYTDECGYEQYMMQVKFKRSLDWMNCYIFKDDEIIPIDIELANWWTSTSPQHKFTKNLIVSNVGKDCRHILVDDVLTIRYIEGSTERISVNNDNVCDIMKSYFYLHFPEGTTFDTLNAVNVTS
jgi:N-hydroxyarylamine O-acetyltransferase